MILPHSRFPAGPPKRIALTLEPLEQRLLLDAGALDLTFDIDGLVTTDFGTYWEDCDSVAIQPDGKIVVAGSAYQEVTDADFALARYNADGSLDTSFDGDGLVTTDFAFSPDHAFGVAIQADGKIVVVGDSDHRFGLARYNADGSLDASFGTGGLVTTDVLWGSDYAKSVAIQADGKIVVAGYSYGSTGKDFAVARYNSDGSLDASFDGDGLVTTNVGTGDDLAYSVAIQTDGKIVVAGRASQSGTGVDFALARYNTDGALDTTFDDDGLVMTAFTSSEDIAHSVAIQADGKIVVAGSAHWPGPPFTPGNSDFAVARYNVDGSLDTAFSSDGKVTTDFGSAVDRATGVAIGADGEVVVAGHSDRVGTSYDFALARYNADGSLDTTFDGDGKVTTDFGAPDYLGGIAIQADGKIVVAGSSWQTDTSHDFAVARYISVSDITPPVVESVEAGADLQSLIVQLNDDDLDPAKATDLANFSLLAANGDADGDGNAFNDGDELQLLISSVTYDSLTDRITVATGEALFDDHFRLELDGDDESGDGTSGITDLAGNHLAGGDYMADLDLTALTAVEDLLADVEALGLSTGTESSLAGKLEAAINHLGRDVGSDRSIEALIDTFARGVSHWYDKGQMTAEECDALLWEVELIRLGFSLLDG
jgi:uncharacterized delta-60 repeat protein